MVRMLDPSYRPAYLLAGVRDIIAEAEVVVAKMTTAIDFPQIAGSLPLAEGDARAVRAGDQAARAGGRAERGPGPRRSRLPEGVRVHRVPRCGRDDRAARRSHGAPAGGTPPSSSPGAMRSPRRWRSSPASRWSRTPPRRSSTRSARWTSSLPSTTRGSSGSPRASACGPSARARSSSAAAIPARPSTSCSTGEVTLEAEDRTVVEHVRRRRLLRRDRAPHGQPRSTSAVVHRDAQLAEIGRANSRRW